jgi:multidrug efflux pump subunit AcrA (membrane-fusion protein)
MNADAPVPADLIATESVDPKSRAVEDAIDGQSLAAKTSKPGGWLRRFGWLLPLALVPVGSVFGMRQLGQTSPDAVTTPPVPVEVAYLQPVDSYSVERQYAGEIVAGRTSSLGFEASGTVVELLVDEGDTVTTGQPLARLDTRTLQTQRQQLVAQRDQASAVLRELQHGPRQQDIAAAQAAVADLEQQVALARLQRDRRENLYNRGAISREELDQETFGTSSLENRLAQARSELDELLSGSRPEQIEAQAARVRQLDASIQAIDIDLSKSVITAPFSGRVSQRLVDEGVVVSGGSPVLKLVEGNTLEARIGVPAEVANQLTAGSSHTIDVGGQAYPATITTLLPELESTSRTVTAVLAIDTDDDLTIGQTARLVMVKTQPAEGFWVPSTALVQGEKGLWSVYVVAEVEPSEATEHLEFEVTRRHVEIIHTEGDRVLVQGVLQPGDRLIPSGIHRIVPGQEVSVVDTQSMPSAENNSPGPLQPETQAEAIYHN